MSSSLNNGTIEKQRAISLDLARGTMLLLIVLAHAPLYLYAADPGIIIGRA
ncbi:glyoxalase, partial [Bacillus mycoides]